VLPPDTLLTRALLSLALAALLVLLVWRTVRKDRREYGRFKRMTRTAERQKMFRKWLLTSFFTFGGASAVVLLLAAQYVPRMLAQVERWPATEAFRGFVRGGGDLFAGAVIGLVAVVVAGGILVVVLGRNADDVPTIGDIGALLPRNRAELGLGAALSINAGVFEELLFRLALPALVFGVTGNAVVATVGSVLLFAALHSYQGIAGSVGSLLIGSLLMLLYLATGSILWPILAHALFDLRSLVLIPMAVYGVHRTTGDPEPVEAPAILPPGNEEHPRD
jgi:membrane protease YdiL (CAAX protease family)